MKTNQQTLISEFKKLKINEFNSNEDERRKTALSFLLNEKNSADLDATLEIIKYLNIDDEDIEREIVLTFLKKTKSKISAEEIIKTQKHHMFDDEEEKLKVIPTYLKNTNLDENQKYNFLSNIFQNPNSSIDTARAFEILDNTELDVNIDHELFLIFVKNSNNKIDIIQILKAINLDNSDFNEEEQSYNESSSEEEEGEKDNSDLKKLRIIAAFLQNHSQENDVDINAIFDAAELENVNNITTFLETSSEAISVNNLMSIANSVEEKIEEEEVDISPNLALAFIKNPNNQITADDFSKIIDLGSQNPGFERKIIITLLERSQFDVELMFKIIEAAEPQDDDERSQILAEFLGNSQTNVTKLIEILNKAGFANNEDTFEVIKSFLNSANNGSQLQLILDIFSNAAAGYWKYETDLICNLYKKFSGDLENSEKAKNLQELTTALYPNNEAIRVDFLISAIAEGIITRENFADLDLNIIKENDLVLDLIEQTKNMGLLSTDPKELLNLVKGRISAKYDFLAEVIGKDQSSNLSNFISTEAMNNLESLFGSTEDITIEDLFSYYDLTDQLGSLSEILTPNFKQEMTKRFHPSEKYILVKKEEIGKLCSLLRKNESDIKKELFSVGDFCDYFSRKADIKPLSIEEKENFEINFEEVCYLSEEIKKELTQGFRDILTKDSDQHIISFFSALLGIDIGSNNKEKLVEFLGESKTKIAYVLQKPGGIDNLLACIPAITDGCAANIGTQFTTALYQSIFQNDHSDATIYQVLMEKVVREIVNTHGGDVIMRESNPLKNTIINSYYLSPEAFYKEIAKIFFDESKEKKIGRNSWEFFKETLGDNSRDALAEVINCDETQAAEIAAYLVLRYLANESSAIENNHFIKNFNCFAERSEKIKNAHQLVSKTIANRDQEETKSNSNKRKREDGEPGYSIKNADGEQFNNNKFAKIT